MKRSISVFTILLLSVLAFAILPPTAAQGYVTDELWVNPMQVNDVAVSKDGNYLAAVNDNGLYYFAWNSPNPRWWYLSEPGDRFMSVAISANGEYVIVGNSSVGAIYYFNNSRARSGPQASNSYTWISVHITGPFESNIQRRTIDISDNGEFIVVGGSGDSVYYFTDCTTKSGTGVAYNWAMGVAGDFVQAVDMSPDGRYFVVGGNAFIPSTGFVDFFDANTPSPHLPVWENSSLGPIRDVSVSDDGYAVSAVSIDLTTTLYYWAGASSMSGWTNTNANWTRLHGFNSVDMSSDGNRVVAGYYVLNVASLHYWDNARTLLGEDVTETWIRVPDKMVFDVGITDDGSLILATTGFPNSALFYTSDGTLVGNFSLDSPGAIVSMAGSGNSAAVGGAYEDSLYFFKITKTNVVGGEVLSIDGLMLLAPYLAVALVAGVVVAGFLLRRRMP